MRILVLADVESKFLWDFYRPEKLEGIDLIISCGDLESAYLEFLVTLGHVPVFYVPGNHDEKYAERPPEGCDNIDNRIVNFNGIRIMGIGGSMKYREGTYLYSEKEMKRRIKKMRRSIISSSGVDILVTHSPARGFGDLEDLPHRGYECFNTLLEQVRPEYMLHGHVHANYGGKFLRERQHPSGTTIINCFERYILEFGDRRNNITRKELIKNFIFGANNK